MLSYAFLNAAQTALHKQYVTTIYVTGKGFEGEWSNEALKELCMGRRIFRGQNLFTHGSCYAAIELSGMGRISKLKRPIQSSAAGAGFTCPNQRSRP